MTDSEQDSEVCTHPGSALADLEDSLGEPAGWVFCRECGETLVRIGSRLVPEEAVHEMAKLVGMPAGLMAVRLRDLDAYIQQM